ncbi:LAQU0S20e01156g1_1 [Lachancea quebecensis]|uniref:Serine/threonine-protein kinase BUR1 n=1 Tax=Lachancea quebecensis TaxID=1654605 RepID=A0A0P1KXA2_9SACH|nr:LAQU0S20e01156g1_1 [Lachancea quebecensis]
MSSEETALKKTDFKYKIGKVKQTPPVLQDKNTGLEYIELKPRANERVYGCTVFQGHYKEDKKLGQGTFGEVYRGVHLETQRQVAMKRTLVKAEKDLFPITAQREITILRKLSHKNVIKLIEMVYDYPPSASGTNGSSPATPTVNSTKSFYMILPYMVADLSGILHNPRIKLEMAAIKNILLQILEGINYIHCQKYMHRDIKTANLLIDHKGVLKIADFGLARNYYGAPPNLKFPGGAGVDAKYTSVVVTRWYRAPELVLGDKHYTTAVDMWGIGCVFGELFEKKPILQGQTDIDQGHVIFKLLGTPSAEDWKLARYLPGAELTRTNYTGNIKERFGKHLTEAGLDLLGNLLCLDPYRRLTAMSAKKHPFFTEEPVAAPTLQLPCEECHEADIKRYKEEQNKSASQLPPPAPQGHMIEKTQNAVPQIPKRPNGPTTGPNSKPPPTRPPTGPRAFVENKRGVPRSAQSPATNAPPIKSAKLSTYSEQSRPSRYSGSYNAPEKANPNTAARIDTRYNSIPKKRYYGGLPSNVPEAPSRFGSQNSRYGQPRDAFSRTSQYSDSRFSNSRPPATTNPNETPLRTQRRDGGNTHPVHQPSSANGSIHTATEKPETHSLQPRQNAKNSEDIANLY